MLVFLAISQWVLPRTVSVTNEIWNREVQGRVALGIYRNGRYFYRGKEGFYSFQRPDPKQNIFLYFSYSSWDANFDLNSIVASRIVNWNGAQWLLVQGQEQKRIGPEQYSTEVFYALQEQFPETPASFFVPAYHTMELSLLELYEATRHQHSPEDTNSLMNRYGLSEQERQLPMKRRKRRSPLSEKPWEKFTIRNFPRTFVFNTAEV